MTTTAPSPADFCPCGAPVIVELVTPALDVWEGKCEAGHRVLITDFDTPPIIQ